MKKKVTFEKRKKALKEAAFILVVSLSVAILPCLITSCGNDPLKPVSTSDTTDPTTDSTGKLISEECSRCHSLDDVRNYPDDDWKDVVDEMIVYGTELTEEEAANIIAHLVEGKSF